MEIPQFESELLSRKVRNWLISEMKEGMFRDLDKLPAEADMAKTLKVSRSVVRDALLDLECDGFVTRLRGTGTLINHHVIKVSTRLDWEIDYPSMLQDAGYTPSLAWARSSLTKAGELISQNLGVPLGTELVMWEKKVLADGKPAILFTDYFQHSLLNDTDWGQIDPAASVFEILETHCDESVFINMSQVEAVCSDKWVSPAMGISVGEPLLHMTGVGHNKFGSPVLFSDIYYTNGLYKFAVLRKKR